MYAILIIGGLAAIVNIACGGISAFNFKEVRAYVHVFFIFVITFGAAVILARHDDLLTNSFSWDQDTIRSILLAAAGGIIGGCALTHIIEWVREEMACREIRNSTETTHALGEIVRDWRAPVRGSRMIGHSLDHHCDNISVGQTIYADPAHLIEEAPALSYHMAEISHDRNGRNLDSRRVWP